ncbi:GerMN domain-containing protein [Dysosmobacter sp.]|uniref:GerMN domain-containing protein n=1 Tax=Dysosmobacter sp. TaxID=2591382 RepID=UPI002A8EDA73|nr:GerMN domain-containing protein [Dysosmobacter sp.]MDY3281460.1 GerMN domain-containing protein [Dysosmobacter sp.]
MKRKRWFTVIFCLLLVLPVGYVLGSRETPEQPGTYNLYYRLRDLEGAGGGDAVAPEPSEVPMDTRLAPEESARLLLERLLAGPASENLVTPFPSGTALLDLTVAGTQAKADLSRAYSALSGVELSLADYCIALTLTQIPGIRTVSVTVNGQDLAYRSNQVFRLRDVLLSTTEDVVGTVDVTLYFLSESGALVGEERTLDLYEGDTRAETLVRALLSGPETKGLTSAIPEGFDVRSIRVEDGECFVNLASSMLSALPAEADLRQAVRALSESLVSLETVDGVRLLVDGELVNTESGTLEEQLFGGNG